MLDDERLIKASPWLMLTGGLAATAGAVGLALIGNSSWLVAARLLLLAVGLLAAASAVVRRPRSSAVLASAGITAWLAGWAAEPDWDSLTLLTGVLATVALVAAVLVCLPRSLQRFAVSLLILAHFDGILTTVASVPPPGGHGPWLTTNLWVWFYRPYLQFLYLNNAYHFYSPEPGPSTLLWFKVNYSDGTSRWVWTPTRKRDSKDPLAISYYRRLSITDSVNHLENITNVPPELTQRRFLAGELKGIPSPEALRPYVPNAVQFALPIEHSKQLLRSYARYIAQENRHADPSVSVTGIKIYRVTHAMLEPGGLAAGMEPTDPVSYWPYYQGEFDAAGNLKDPNDPFLYWLIPIIRVESEPLGLVSKQPPEMVIKNYVTVHAGSNPWEGQ